VRFAATPIAGAFHVEIEPHEDARGFFTRLWCQDEFAKRDLNARFVQASMSRNARKGTLRGMHMQLAPSRECKLVRCARGRIYDVIIDLRPESPSFLQHFAVELDAAAENALYIPFGVLHGFQTLVDDCDVVYDMTDFHAPELAYGARWNDPLFGIRWPATENLVIAPRDAQYPDFEPDAYARMLAAERVRS
jgi:dTDP-4-dehydrorhamnose 3,5-epimerase